MYIDARRIPAGTTLDADVCIVGAGAAGIALAREFVGGPLRVCLLESGGFRMDRATQRLYVGESVGVPYDLETTRSRFFGGSTNCWGGFCRPFEPYHFERRDWVPDSGWPLSRDDLEPYYLRGHDVFGLPARAARPTIR
jgi:choline dehydrogenase-like flavoprotein